jgi:hypothetical protein
MATNPPGPETFDFSRMDPFRSGRRAGLAIRGHTLWHRLLVSGVAQHYDFDQSGGRSERLLSTHIRTVTEGYRGVITSYDVVNEAIDHDTDGLIETSLSRAMGSAEAVLDLAFHTARASCRRATGLQRLHELGAQHAAHRADVLRLLEGFESGTRAGRRARHSVAHRDASLDPRRASVFMTSVSGAGSSMRCGEGWQAPRHRVRRQGQGVAGRRRHPRCRRRLRGATST